MVTPILKRPHPDFSSGLNYDELWEFYPCFFDKCSSICSGGKYSESNVKFVKDILEYLEDWDSISWQQFCIVLIIGMKHKYDTYSISLDYGYQLLYRNGECIIIQSNQIQKIPTTDFQFDRTYQTVYGKPLYFDKEERYGLTRSYTKFGERIFKKII